MQKQSEVEMKQFSLIGMLFAAAPTMVLTDSVEAEADLFFSGQTVVINQSCSVNLYIFAENVDHLYIGSKLVGTMDLSGQTGVLTNGLDQMMFVDMSLSLNEMVGSISDFFDEIMRSHGFSEGYGSLEYVQCL